MTLAPEDAGVSASADPRPAPRRRWLIVSWGVAVLAIGLAAFSTWQWQDLEAAEDARTEVAVVATNFLTELTNWDAQQGLDPTVQALREMGTGRFLDQVDELFGGSVAADLEAASARSDGEVADLFVQTIEGDHAEVFGVVRQEVTSDATDGTETTLHRALIQLQRVDGAWRIEHLDTQG